MRVPCWAVEEMKKEIIPLEALPHGPQLHSALQVSLSLPHHPRRLHIPRLPGRLLRLFKHLLLGPLLVLCLAQRLRLFIQGAVEHGDLVELLLGLCSVVLLVGRL